MKMKDFCGIFYIRMLITKNLSTKTQFILIMNFLQWFSYNYIYAKNKLKNHCCCENC